MTEVNITIDQQGNSTIKVLGVAGPSCKSLTEGIEKALGTVTKDVKTPEFLQQANQSNHQKAGM